MGGFDKGDNKGKGDGHRFVHEVPLDPDDRFYEWVKLQRSQLKTPEDKIDFERELEESQLAAIQKYADGIAAKSMKSQPPKQLESRDPMQKYYDDLAKEQAKVHAQMKEQIIQDLLKKGVIHSRAEIEDWRNPRFKDNQVYLEPITQKLMELQMKMIPPYKQSE